MFRKRYVQDNASALAKVAGADEGEGREPHPPGVEEISEAEIRRAFDEARNRIFEAHDDLLPGIRNPDLAIRLLTMQVLRTRYPNASPVSDDRLRQLR